MDPSDPLHEIRELLQHEYLRRRREGIQKAADLLAQGMYRQPLRAILSRVAQGDLATGLAELAQRTLAEDDQRQQSDPPRYASGAEHMVGKSCPHCLHPNYYDKRQLCGEDEGFRRIERAGKATGWVWVTCDHCGKRFKIEVDCEGYR